MEGYRTCKLFLHEESYDLCVRWVEGLECEVIKVSSDVFIEFGIFDESRPTFEDYDADSAIAAQLLELKLELLGYAVEPGFNMLLPVRELCAPGPGNGPQPTVRIAKLPVETLASIRR